MNGIYDFSGVWLSKYRYHSDSRHKDFDDAHYVRIYQHRNRLVIESLPDVNESYIIINLTLHEDLATGTWQETTAPMGYYEGTTYYGATQLVIAPDGKSMQGKWMGAGRNKEINVGPFSLTYIGEELPANAKPALHAASQRAA